MGSLADAVTGTKDGVTLSVEVSAGTDRDLFPSRFNPWRNTIGCRVSAPALDGRANRNVVALIATVLSVPPADVEIVSGQSSTVKRVLVRHADPGTIRETLADLLREPD